MFDGRVSGLKSVKSPGMGLVTPWSDTENLEVESRPMMGNRYGQK